MKYSLLIFTMLISLNVNAEYRVQSPNYNQPSEQQSIHKLKNYISQAKKLINRYEGVLNNYENTLKGFSGLRRKCSSYGSSFSYAHIYAGCNNDLNNLSVKLRNIAYKLDAVEVKIINTKHNIQIASDILIGIDKKHQIERQADHVLADIRKIESRSSELSRQAN